QAEDGIRDRNVTGVQTCALPISSRILSNAMGFRIESASLERRSCFAGICHLGLSSPSGGAVLDSEREVSRVLGTAIYQYLKHWEIGRASCRERGVMAVDGR